MLDQETPTLPPDQQKLLQLILPKVLENSEGGSLRSRALLGEDVSLPSAIRALKLLTQIGVLGPEEASNRSVNRSLAEQILRSIEDETKSPSLPDTATA